MTWTHANYDGVKANGPAGGWITGMFEVCRAINERQNVASGLLAETAWIRADGTSGANLPLGDFQGMQLNGGDSLFVENLEKINSAVVNLIPHFVKLSGGLPDGREKWTRQEIESEIGLSLLLPSKFRTTDGRYMFQAYQDTLDLLRYLREDIGLPSGTPYSGTIQTNFSGSNRSGEALPPPSDLLTPAAAHGAINTWIGTATMDDGLQGNWHGTIGAWQGNRLTCRDYLHHTGATHYDALLHTGAQGLQIDFSTLDPSFLPYSTWYRVGTENSMNNGFSWSFGGAGSEVQAGAPFQVEWYKGTAIAPGSVTEATLSASLSSSVVGAMHCEIYGASLIYGIDPVLTD